MFLRYTFINILHTLISKWLNSLYGISKPTACSHSPFLRPVFLFIIFTLTSADFSGLILLSVWLMRFKNTGLVLENGFPGSRREKESQCCMCSCSWILYCPAEGHLCIYVPSLILLSWFVLSDRFSLTHFPIFIKLTLNPPLTVGLAMFCLHKWPKIKWRLTSFQPISPMLLVMGHINHGKLARTRGSAFCPPRSSNLPRTRLLVPMERCSLHMVLKWQELWRAADGSPHL